MRAARLALDIQSDSKWSIDPVSLKVCRHENGAPMKLGSGGFGSVYKAVQDDVRVVAVKLANTGEEGNAKHIEAFWKEAELLASLHDKNVVQFFGAAVSGVSLRHRQCTQSSYLISASMCLIHHQSTLLAS